MIIWISTFICDSRFSFSNLYLLQDLVIRRFGIFYQVTYSAMDITWQTLQYIFIHLSSFYVLTTDKPANDRTDGSHCKLYITSCVCNDDVLYCIHANLVRNIGNFSIMFLTLEIQFCYNISEWNSYYQWLPNCFDGKTRRDEAHGCNHACQILFRLGKEIPHCFQLFRFDRWDKKNPITNK